MQKRSFKTIEQQLANRKKDSLKSLFHLWSESSKELSSNILLLSPSDQGVCRNGGRRGSSFAPQAILAILGKMAKREKGKITLYPVIDQKDDNGDFTELQNKSSVRINQLLPPQNNKNYFHIGGGHDHIYPLLANLGRHFSDITVINIDPHLDTRPDPEVHSGTPFRQFAKEYKGNLELIQVGTHDYANTDENYRALGKHKMRVLESKKLMGLELQNEQAILQFFSQELPYNPKTFYLLSLDCDAIESDTMEAVSAVNHLGLPPTFIYRLFNYYQSTLCSKQAPVVGIYEYNPVYDNLSQKGARFLAALIYQHLK